MSARLPLQGLEHVPAVALPAEPPAALQFEDLGPRVQMLKFAGRVLYTTFEGHEEAALLGDELVDFADQYTYARDRLDCEREEWAEPKTVPWLPDHDDAYRAGVWLYRGTHPQGRDIAHVILGDTAGRAVVALQVDFSDPLWKVRADAYRHALVETAEQAAVYNELAAPVAPPPVVLELLGSALRGGEFPDTGTSLSDAAVDAVIAFLRAHGFDAAAMEARSMEERTGAQLQAGAQ